jgi:hypothetical protein
MYVALSLHLSSLAKLSSTSAEGSMLLPRRVVVIASELKLSSISAWECNLQTRSDLAASEADSEVKNKRGKSEV